LSLYEDLNFSGNVLNFIELKSDTDTDTVSLTGYAGSDSAPSFSMFMGCSEGSGENYGAGLLFNKGDSSSQNSAKLSVDDSSQELEFNDDSDNGVLLGIENGTPKLLLSDVYDDPSSGNTIEASIATGPLFKITDDGGNSIALDLTENPLLKLEDETGNSIELNVNSGPQLKLEDDAGAFIDININGDPTITIGDSKLTDGDIDLGATGTVTINGEVYEPVDASWCDASGAFQTGKLLAFIG